MIVIRILADAIDKARSLPVEMQEDIAHLLMTYLETDQSVIQLTAEEDADLAEAEAEVARGELATDDEVAAVLGKSKF